MNPKLSLDHEDDRREMASQLYQRFCHDLQDDPGRARTRLVNGIIVALRDAAEWRQSEQLFPASHQQRRQGDD